MNVGIILLIILLLIVAYSASAARAPIYPTQVASTTPASTVPAPAPVPSPTIPAPAPPPPTSPAIFYPFFPPFFGPENTAPPTADEIYRQNVMIGIVASVLGLLFLYSVYRLMKGPGRAKSPKSRKSRK